MEKQLIPQLRFSEFKDNWVTKKLIDLGALVNGLTYSPNDVNVNGVLVLRSSNIQNNQLSFLDNVYVKADDFNAVAEEIQALDIEIAETDKRIASYCKELNIKTPF